MLDIDECFGPVMDLALCTVVNENKWGHMIAPCGVDLVRAPVPGPKRMAMFMNWAGLCIRTKHGRTYDLSTASVVPQHWHQQMCHAAVAVSLRHATHHVSYPGPAAYCHD